MFSCTEYVFFSVVSTFISVQGEVILGPTEKDPKCEYDGLRIDLSNAGLHTIGGNLFSSPSTDPLINCVSLANNNIEKLNETAFTQLPNLYYLDLSENSLPFENFRYDFSTVKTLVLNEIFFSHFSNDCHYQYDSNSDRCQGYYNGVRFRIFSSLMNLEKLYLRRNKLWSLSWKREIPNITHLYLDENQINPEFLPLYIPPTLTHLSLSLNGINQFNRSPILKQLEELNLDYNQIQILCFDDNCHDPPPQDDSDEAIMNRWTSPPPVISQFMDLKGGYKLKKLSISGNRLQDIREDAFIHLENLQYLNLAGNNLENTSTSKVFQHLNRTKTLILDRNQYQTIPNLYGLNNLEILMLKGNQIEAITLTSFGESNLPILKILSLANNVIDKIDPGSFNNLRSLNELDLSGNKLVTLPANWIPLDIEAGINSNSEKLISPELNRLHLDRNRFTNIENMALENITEIQYLNIGGNPFEELSIQSLRNLPENTVINVKNIQLVNENGNKPSNSDGSSNCYCSGITICN